MNSTMIKRRISIALELKHAVSERLCQQISHEDFARQQTRLLEEFHALAEFDSHGDGMDEIPAYNAFAHHQ